MIVIGFDVETTGLDPIECQVLEVGAVSYCTQSDQIISVFRALVDNGEVKGQPYAMAMNSKLLFEIAARKGTKSPYSCLCDLEKWLKMLSPDGKPYAAGFNVGGFDLQFHLGCTKLATLFHHRRIELGSLLAVDGVPMGSKEAAKKYLAKADFEHTALQDARDAIELYRQHLGYKPVA